MSLRRALVGVRSPLSLILEILLIVPLFILALIGRIVKKRIDVGIGPEPLISNIYHAMALRLYGYTAETFVFQTYFITDQFDINLAKKRMELLPDLWRPLWLFIRSLFMYRCLMIYFNGGSLYRTLLLRKMEHWYYKLAGVKVIVMPYGSDVQDMRFSPNLYFKHTVSCDYPEQHRYYNQVAENVARWTRYGDWIIAGVEWVDYMYHWNTLLLAHFSIDTEKRWVPLQVDESDKPDTVRPFRILHAPNHQMIKGSQVLYAAIEQLQAEGLEIELVVLRGVPNHKIQEAIGSVDLVADQFVVGWYAFFAIEAMALERPVLCYLRDDLIELYTKAGLIEPNEIPIINTSLLQIADRIRWAYHHREELQELGVRGRRFVLKHHSMDRMGQEFKTILEKLGISPAC